jgi:flagellar basal body-associated protein FliL
MFCKNCGSEISNESKFCNTCGSPVETIQTAPSSLSKKKTIVPIAIIAGIIIIIAAIYIFGISNNNNNFYYCDISWDITPSELEDWIDENRPTSDVDYDPKDDDNYYSYLVYTDDPDMFEQFLFNGDNKLVSINTIIYESENYTVSDLVKKYKHEFDDKYRFVSDSDDENLAWMSKNGCFILLIETDESQINISYSHH